MEQDQPAATESLFGPPDPAMDAKLQKRRAMEAARLQRIKDPKSRVMGIDTDALAAQVEEKQLAAAREKQLSMAYDQQRLSMDNSLAYMEQERLRIERVQKVYIDEFRHTEQGKGKMREYDLNDPLALKKDLPARCGDDDPRLSVSGLQKFNGEDLTYAHRVKVQQAELKSWMDEAVAAKKAAQAHEKEMDSAFAKQALEVDQMKTQLEQTSRMVKSDQNRNLAEYQLAQAAAKAEREAAAQKAELRDNVQEIQAHMSGDLLAENAALGYSYIDPNRLRPDHYKGMTAAQKEDVLRVQEVQRLNNLEKKAAAKAEQADYDNAAEQQRQQGCYADAQVAAMRAEMRKQMQEKNVSLASQQFAAKSFLKTNIYTNAIDASFYDQFGTSSR